MTGDSCGVGTGEDYATIAYDADTGGQLWVARYAGPHNDDCFLDVGDRPASMALSADGSSLYVTGTSPGKNILGDIATVSYDAATGTQRWVKRYTVRHLTRGASAESVAVSPDGTRVFVNGTIPPNGSDFVTISYESATGKMLWLVSYNGPANSFDQAADMGIGPDGERVYVSGYSGGEGSDVVYATLAYDALTGAQLWEARGPPGGDGVPWALAVDPFGEVVFVTGNGTGDPSHGTDFLTIAYQA